MLAGFWGILFAYGSAGVFLGRRSHRVFRYHPLRANLNSVAHSKLHFVATWLITTQRLIALGVINQEL
jgi:hypothetical protein